jgi:hypothetical protein
VTWIKLDDGYAEHEKLLEAGPHALALDIRGMCYCARRLTDGLVPSGAIPALMVDLDPGALEALLRVGRWEEAKGGYQIHDYLVYNPSKAEVLAERDRWKGIHSAGGRARAASASRIAGRFAPKGHQPAGVPAGQDGGQQAHQQGHQQEDRQLRHRKGLNQQHSSRLAGDSAGSAHQQTTSSTSSRTPADGEGEGERDASKGEKVTLMEMAEQLQETNESDWWFFEGEYQRRGALPQDIEEAKAIARCNGRGQCG